MLRTLARLTAVSCCVLAASARADGEGSLDENILEAQADAALQGKSGSWVPVPIPISNPTVGTGMQGVLLYLHPNKTEGGNGPNVTSGLVGMYTNNQSWAAGAFHDGNWDAGTYRYRLLMGVGKFNLKFYGIGDDPIFAYSPVKYGMRAWGLGGELQRRVPGTENWYAGFSYRYLDSEVDFELSSLLPNLPDVSKPFRNAGLGLLTTYDSRDDNYFPHQGRMFRLSLTDHGDAWGGDYEYAKLKAFYNHYLPLRASTTLALRAHLQSSNGNTPFFDLPYLNMRGFSRDRYRDQNSLSLHAEARHKFKPRWGAVAFFEAGWIADEFDHLFQHDVVTSYGAGLRWQTTADKALHLAVDLAFSEGDSVVHVRVGEMF
ncbi:MAG: BamA/TamA family outer membrane protein [Anderseniella sp.]|jgi:outer membrane protein assembly factor BamA|nr:BamA/TamA family outer membrane protein [Anderseniella sp.]